MKAQGKTTWLVGAAVGILLLVSEQSRAQTSVQNWNVAGPATWNDDANWEHATDPAFSGIPLADFDDSANIGNSGTAFVAEAVQDFIGLMIPNGTLDVQQGGAMKSTGDTTVGGGGILRLSGNGALETGDLTNGGLIELVGNNASLSTRGDLTHTGNLIFDISAAGNPVINVGGSASLRGTVEPNIAADVDLSFGSSWEFVSATNFASQDATIVPPAGTTLDRGLQFQLQNGSITVGSLPILTVDRESGHAEIENVQGAVTITGYSITSPLGLLNPQGWTSLEDQQVEGWSEANPREQQISELNSSSTSTLEAGQILDLGNAYNVINGGNIPPPDEDVAWAFTTPDSILQGLVEYTGTPNNLVLRVDPDNGEAVIRNLSKFADPFDVKGYRILSSSEALLVESWNSFFDSSLAGEGWVEANPKASVLAELNLENSHSFGEGTVINIGSIFTPGGLRDLAFEFANVAGELLVGTVEYGELGIIVVPGDCNGDGNVDAADLTCVATIEERDNVLAMLNTLPGDLNGNGDVAFPDFLTLSASFGDPAKTLYTDGNIDLLNGVAFSDFLVLSANFGKTPAAGATAAAVPEPSCLILVSLGALYLLGRRRNGMR